MKEKILHMLLNSEKEFLSGEDISKTLGITRSAVWKHIKALKDKGYDIKSISSKGYKINNDMDILSEKIILENIETSFIGKEVSYFEELDSTNDYAKKVGDDATNGKLIITEMQTNGRGRMGKNWHGKKGVGLYFSIILKPDMHPHRAPFITQIVAASVSNALSSLGISNFIKWPNDILINGKKICGILTEMASEIEYINYVVVGIGINVLNDFFADEIKDVATSLKIEGYEIKRIGLLKEILKNFEALYLEYAINNDKSNILNICKDKSYLIGKNIFVIRNNNKTLARALDLNEEGNLIVEYEDKSREELISGEVSVRRENIEK